MVAGSDDALALVVFDVLNVLVLPLSALPDLDFTSTADDAHSHRGEKVVSGIGMIVDAAVEDGGGVLADAGADHSFSTWVFFDEIRDVVNDTSDGDQASSVLGLILIVFPIHDWQRIERYTPVELGALLVERLLHLLNSALLDLVRFELLEVVCEAELLPDPDRPLRRVILMPLDSIAVIRGEFVVEVVVSFTECNERGDDVIPGRVAVVERLVAKPMGKGVDAECCLLHDEST